MRPSCRPALAGGKGADVIHTHAYGWLEQFVKAGYFVQARRRHRADAGEPPGRRARRPLSYRGDGQVYAVPFASQTLGLFINKDVFAKAGLTPPKTWDEFVSRQQGAEGQGHHPARQRPWHELVQRDVRPAIFTNPFLGPDFVRRSAAGKTTFKDPRYIAALGKLLELRDYMPPSFAGVDYDTAGQLFLTGRAAMLAGGSFDIATYKAQNPDRELRFHRAAGGQSGRSAGG